MHQSINQSINQSIFIGSKCPEIHIKGFSIASRTIRLRPALTAAQLINYTMKEKEKLNTYNCTAIENGARDVYLTTIDLSFFDLG